MTPSIICVSRPLIAPRAATIWCRILEQSSSSVRARSNASIWPRRPGRVGGAQARAGAPQTRECGLKKRRTSCSNCREVRRKSWAKTVTSYARHIVCSSVAPWLMHCISGGLATERWKKLARARVFNSLIRPVVKPAASTLQTMRAGVAKSLS